MKKLFFADAQEWRDWLSKNHNKEDEIWLVFNKIKTGEPILEYEKAVDEALCYGWIDSLIKKIDEKQYARKFNPRRDTSKWSDLNKKRIARLIQSNRMTSFGLKKIEIAKKNGMWEKADIPPQNITMPNEFFDALNDNPAAKSFYESLAPGYRKPYILWIGTAKQPETRNKRIRESIKLLANGQKLGLK